MKCSELEELLKKTRKEYGDIEVILTAVCGYENIENEICKEYCEVKFLRYEYDPKTEEFKPVYRLELF